MMSAPISSFAVLLEPNSGNSAIPQCLARRCCRGTACVPRGKERGSGSVQVGRGPLLRSRSEEWAAWPSALRLNRDRSLDDAAYSLFSLALSASENARLLQPHGLKRPHQLCQRHLRRLPPIQNRLNDGRGEQRETEHATDVG